MNLNSLDANRSLSPKLTGSPGRDRTYDRRLTLVPLLLMGVDYIISEENRSEALRPRYFRIGTTLFRDSL